MDRAAEAIIFELADMNPSGDYIGTDCKFCNYIVPLGLGIDLMLEPNNHEQICLWRRSKKEAEAIREYYK